MTVHVHRLEAAVEQAREPMLLGHYLTYQIARSNLCALAETATAGQLHDYWDVLELIDSLHTPMGLAVALPMRGVSRYAMYDAARHAIRHLSRYGLNPVVLRDARDVLDATWADDPGTKR